jgi:hypothetical protein
MIAKANQDLSSSPFVLVYKISKSCLEEPTWSVFGSVVAGAFQIAFRAEIHANDVFSFFKNYF